MDWKVKPFLRCWLTIFAHKNPPASLCLLHSFKDSAEKHHIRFVRGLARSSSSEYLFKFNLIQDFGSGRLVTVPLQISFLDRSSSPKNPKQLSQISGGVIMKLSGCYDLQIQYFSGVMISLHVTPLMALISPTAFIAGVPNTMIEPYIVRVQKEPRSSNIEHCAQANGDFPT
jgi:hypothetical protein